MSTLFAGPNTQASQNPAPVSALRIQSSVLGKPWALCYGTVRLAPNLLWTGDFVAFTTPASDPGGGKGLFDTPSAGGQSSTTYLASYALGLCVGGVDGSGIVGIGTVWRNNGKTDASQERFAIFTGTTPQTPWSYLETHHQAIDETREIPSSPGPYTIQTSFHAAPFSDGGVIDDGGNVYTKVGSGPTAQQYAVNTSTGVYTFSSANAGATVTITYQAGDQQPRNQALGYNGLAYVGAIEHNLQDSPSLPNYNIEVQALFANSVAGFEDADPSLVVADILARAKYPAAMVGDLTDCQNYSIASGLLLSVAYTEQKPAGQMLSDIAEAINCAIVTRSGQLTLVPYGDEAITANGKTYTPPAAPVVDLTDDDYVPNQGTGSSSSSSSSTDPVIVTRTRPADRINSVNVEFLNRATDYNPEIASAKDQALIDAYGLRQAPSAQGHMFALASAARMSAQLGLQRQSRANDFTITVDARYAVLELMDWVTLTDSILGLSRAGARITSLDENDDDTFTFELEEFLDGAGASAIYSFDQADGFSPDTNAAPGNTSAPIIFEPTAELLGGASLEVWLGLCGVVPTTWGGCDVWVSNDGQTYSPVGRQLGNARMGVTTATLAPVTVSATGQTIDTVNTLSVDLSESDATLTSGSQADALALNTLCFVDGEYIAYENAVSTGTDKFDLSYLVRGALGTEDEIVSHAAGSEFLRLDGLVFKVPFTQDRIGQTLYFKFTSFNIYGGAEQTLADVEPVTYTLQGSALATPLPQVQNLRTVFDQSNGFEEIWWDEVADFRTGIRYIVRKGDAYATAQQNGDYAHPPVKAFGPGTYWIVAYCQPVPGLIVYSETPASITITGNLLVASLVSAVDFQALNWPGTAVGIGVEGSPPTSFIRLTGTTNVLAESNVLTDPDELNSGGIVASGTLEFDPSTWINIGYLADAYINASWNVIGLPVGQNILTIAQILALLDTLASASTQFVSGHSRIEISIATDPSSDVYAPADVFSPVDVFSANIAWGAWQSFVPGVYHCQLIKFRAVLETVDGATIAYMLNASVEVSVKPRIDHYQGLNVGTGGVTITFVPDTQNGTAPFNGGPLLGGVANAPLPIVSVSWSNNATATWIEDSLTLAALTGHFEDGLGNHIAVNNVNIIVEGY